MTSLFEDLPAPRLSLADVKRQFEVSFWPHVPPRGNPPMRVEKKGTLSEYLKAVKSGDSPEMLSQAVKVWAVREAATDPQYIPSARKWLHHGRQHDEAVPINRVDDLEQSWLLRAANIKAGGKEPLAVVKGCYERGMITREEGGL